jgi:hypothetical protein
VGTFWEPSGNLWELGSRTVGKPNPAKGQLERPVSELGGNLVGTSGELGGNPEGLFHGSGHVGGAEMNSVSEVEFESATLTVRQRKEKPGGPWYAFLRYYVQTGTNEDGTPVMSRKQMAHRLVGAATRKGATAAANEWVTQLRNEQAAARAVVAERRAEEERKAGELRKAEEEEKAVRLHGYLLSYLASRDDLEPSTILDMKACISRIIRTTEDVPLKDFSRQMAKEWRKSMDSRYAYNTVKKTYNVFFAAMSAAYADGLVPANVVDAAAVTNSREKKRRKFAYQSKDNYLDKENRTILLSELDRMEDCSTKTAAILALYTGDAPRGDMRSDVARRGLWKACHPRAAFDRHCRRRQLHKIPEVGFEHPARPARRCRGGGHAQAVGEAPEGALCRGVLPRVRGAQIRFRGYVRPRRPDHMGTARVFPEATL